MSRKLLICVVATVCVLAIAIVGLRTTPRKFDSEVWQQAPGRRPQMLADLMAKHELKGLRRSEVDRLLGVPKGQDSIKDGAYIYWVGYRGIDDEWMDVRFDENIVVDIRIYPD